MPQYRVMIAEFPYGGSTRHETSDYMVKLTGAMAKDPRVGTANTFTYSINDTPITMTRNRALEVAEKNKIDFLVMLDSDMDPDNLLGLPGTDAKPFWETSFEFALNSPRPCMIAAPYCGPPPHENVYIFRWTNHRTGDPNPNFRIEQFSRFEAASLRGIQEVAALPTGLILMDMRAIRRMPHPRFYYEYTDETRCYKASTEDVTFSRDASLLGIPLFCNWDAWAGHFKMRSVSKPRIITPLDVSVDLHSPWIAPASERDDPQEYPAPIVRESPERPGLTMLQAYGGDSSTVVGFQAAFNSAAGG